MNGYKICRSNPKAKGPKTWLLRWDGGVGPDGKRIRPSETFKGSADEADARLRAIISTVDKGTHVTPSKLTVAACAEQWIEYLEERKKEEVSDRTREFYSHQLRAHVVPFVGETMLQKLQPVDVETMYETLAMGDPAAKRRKLGPQSIQHVHRALFACMRYALRRKLIATNPCADVDRPAIVKKKVVVLGDEKMAAFLDGLSPRDPTDAEKAARRWRMTSTNRRFLYWLSVLASCTGLRRGELLALRWCDVDLAHGLVVVDKALDQTIKFGVRLKSTKSGRERTITIPKELCEALTRYRVHQKEEWLLLGVRPVNEAEALLLPVSPDQPDAWCPPNLCSKRFSSYARAVGMPGLKLHGLRHSHASQLIAAGYGIADVAQTLGHSTPAITMSTYAHAIEGAQKKMAATMGLMLGKMKTK